MVLGGTISKRVNGLERRKLNIFNTYNYILSYSYIFFHFQISQSVFKLASVPGQHILFDSNLLLLHMHMYMYVLIFKCIILLIMVFNCKITVARNDTKCYDAMLRANEHLCSAGIACGKRRTKAQYIREGRKKNRGRWFCRVECACLHDARDREHHFVVENVQLHSSCVENKQSSLYSSPFRKLAQAFLDHELQKPVSYQRLSAQLRKSLK